jgi:hypothetical protein
VTAEPYADFFRYQRTDVTVLYCIRLGKRKKAFLRKQQDWNSPKKSGYVIKIQEKG